jgi:formylglycine-generating enzyme required for sulfatase activity
LGCLSENTLQQLLDGMLSEPRIRATNVHLDTCRSCRELLSTLTLSLSTPCGSGPGPEEAGSASEAGSRSAIPLAMAPGTAVGRFIVQGPLGAGGMGVVYGADDPVLGRKVALKLIHADHGEGSASEEWRARLILEARSIARLSHPNVITVHEIGLHGDQPFVAMELVEGSTLRSWLTASRRSWRDIVAVFVAAGRGLLAAHRAGLVHRDFKPDNVLIGRDGQVRVTDFGLACPLPGIDRHAPYGPAPEGPGKDLGALGAYVEGRQGRLTRTGALVGTPGYIAPEVLCGRGAEFASDQFSFCVTLYEALFERRPLFEGNLLLRASPKPRVEMSGPETGVERTPAARVRSDRHGVPGWLQRAVQRGLCESPEDRYPSMDGLLHALVHEPVRRRRRVLTAIAAVVLAGAGALGLAIRAKARREVEWMVVDRTRAATAAQLTARWSAIQLDGNRKRALGLFDAHRWNEGEEAWIGVEATALREEREYRAAFSHLEAARLLDPQHAGLRRWAADLMFERLVRAERSRRRDLVDELASRLFAYDDGRYKIELGAAATVQLSPSPETTQVWIEHSGAPGAPIERDQIATLALQPGSVVLSFEAQGHVPTRLPILLARGETLAVRIALPRLESAPPGMIYVPPGRFLFGSADGYDVRRLFNAAPLHEVWTDGDFNARYEVTLGEWIEFLNDLPPDERRKRSPQTSLQPTFMLSELGPRRWKLTMAPSTHTYTAQTGERLRYLARARRTDQDWTRFPVSAVSFEDAIAYADWLDRTGRLPGARLCDDYEWERAARGADGRTFPSGNALAPDDANIDVTYGRQPLGFGPDEVGSHPQSRSPVGADDMAGNVWEWTRSVQSPGMPVVRGGSWIASEISARSMNREAGEPTMHHSSVGVRLCATP